MARVWPKFKVFAGDDAANVPMTNRETIARAAAFTNLRIAVISPSCFDVLAFR